MSGTTAGISAIGTNDSATFAIHGNYNSESAGILLSSAMNGKLVNLNSTQLQKAIGNLINPMIASGDNGFVVYNSSNSGFYFVDNSGVITQVTAAFTGLTIDTIANLDGLFYAFDSLNNKVLNSTNGINWTLVSGAVVPAKFAKVINVSGLGYAALSTSGSLYTGSTPSSITTLQTLAYTPEQMAASGNNLVLAKVSDNGDAIAYFYHPTNNSLGTEYKTMQIDFAQYIPGVDKSLITNYTITQLFLSTDSIYAIGDASVGGILHFSAAISGQVKSGKSAIAAITEVTNSLTSNSPLVGALTNNLLLLANTNVGISGKIINNVMSPSSTNNGSMTLIRNVNYDVMGTESNVAVNYDNLATGNKYVQFMGVAGNNKYFALVTKNGGVVSSISGEFVLGKTIVNENVAPATPDTIAGIRGVNNTLLAYANSTNNPVVGTGNLYYSDTNGLSWDTIALASLPRASSQGSLTGASVSIAGDKYLITTFDATNHLVSYLTKAPADLTTWVVVPNTASPNLVYLNNQLFGFTSNSSVFDYLSNNNWSTASNNLPALFESSTGPSIAPVITQNIAVGSESGNLVYAMAESNSAVVWTSNNILSGSWSSQNVNFYVNNSIFSGKTFPSNSPVMVWTGKIWLTVDNASFLYSSTDLVNLYSITLNNDGTTFIPGTPILF